MRIFEDEIIKRIKIIQNFVKNLDAKVIRLKSKGLKAKPDSKDSSKEQIAVAGGLNQEQVKELIKWDLEVTERKLEDRVKYMEG